MNSSSASISTPAGYHPEAPLPIKGSGQLHGETTKDFFSRRSERNRLAMQKESSSERRAREQRIKNAAPGKVPGRKGARVFCWEDQEGFRIRTPVGYQNYIERWSDYHGAQRRYDAFLNEWDLCSEFDPDAKSDWSDGDEGSDEDPPMTSQPKVRFPDIHEVHSETRLPSPVHSSPNVSETIQY